MLVLGWHRALCTSATERNDGGVAGRRKPRSTVWRAGMSYVRMFEGIKLALSIRDSSFQC